MLRRQNVTRAVRWTGAALLAGMLGTGAGEAAVVRGQFNYMDTNGPVPIRHAHVEIWYRDVNWWDVWAVIAVTRTRYDGTISFSDDRSRGTFAVRIFAVNEAAIVWPQNLHHEWFHRDPGEPDFQMHLSPTSSSSVLDFSWTFTEAHIAEHFNLAETALIGYEYAMARRDPSETDQLTQVNIQPMAVLAAAYYDSVVNQIFIQSSDSLRDFLILHEYGHAVHAHLGHQARIPSFHSGCAAYNYQGGDLINSPQHAFMEAFAGFFAAGVVRSAPPGNSLSVTMAPSSFEWPPTCSSVIGRITWSGFIVTPAMIEMLVLATLWDLFDPAGHPEQGVETHDKIAGEDTTVLQIIDRELDVSTAPTVFMFRTAWLGRGKDIAGLDCILSTHGILPERPGCRRSAAVKLVGRFNADNWSDIALTGAAGWERIPVALSRGDGRFNLDTSIIPDFPALAADWRAAKLTGDFNNDGLTDIALAIPGSSSIPVALATGSGGFNVVNVGNSLVMYPQFSRDPTSQTLAGDFDADGDTDIALIGPWPVIPIAWSDGEGGFFDTLVDTTNHFSWMASNVRSTTLAGDFNGDRRTDILILGVPGARYLPIMYSAGHGSFYPGLLDAGDFAIWATTPGVKILTGDFDGDRRTDVALTGAAGWNTAPLLLMGYGVVNAPVGGFAGWSSSPAAIRLAGDFDGNGTADLALTGVPGWATLPVALSYGGTFLVANPGVGEFAAWSTSAGAEALVGDFNGDGKQDVALTGVAGWGTVPVAFATVEQTALPLSFAGSLSRVTFTVTNSPIGEFAVWASAP